MKPGVMTIEYADGSITATLYPEGWVCDDPDFRDILQTAYAPEPTPAEPTWMNVFDKAVIAFGADIDQQPEQDPPPEDEDPGTIY